MNPLNTLKKYDKPKIGLYSTGLKAYWGQFPGLKKRLEGYGKFIESKMSEWGEIFNYGLIDSEEKGRDAGNYFNENSVDIIFVHAATYATSSMILPIHQRSNAKVVMLNLQPSKQLNYKETNTGEWLAHCGACPVPEFANALNRSGIEYKVVSGLLGLEKSPEMSVANEVTKDDPKAIRAWTEIREWIQAAHVKNVLSNAKFGFLGNTYNGMLDLYSDFTMIQAQTGIQVDVLEMCDLDEILPTIKENDINRKERQTLEMFSISEGSPSEQLAKKPTKEALTWAYHVAAAQEKLIKERNLDGFTYYYHGAPGNAYEKLQSGFILGNSLLTAQHVPAAGEGDIKTNIAMKICDVLGVGGSFCEIVTTDYVNETILLGHDGPFHLEISNGKPILRSMGLYHGKQGSGVSVEAKVKSGPVTTLGLTQTGDGKLKLIISEGEATDGETMKIGNTQTHVRFNTDPDSYFERWFEEAPTHHCAMSIGNNANLFKKVGDLLGIKTVII
ncbi:L-fucose/L-arabinose isomerase family protein [Gracilibacillus massiliensis]|uniref:L-fucose/L-arabinose isomerase family protein n=1 Tax=Gracilibacillus massiliensis TaxID=1564956 RepID=UPI000AD127DF|nr:L-fucose/L-arabinose isomerase family protein [Gracilibacillus massiliensis]